MHSTICAYARQNFPRSAPHTIRPLFASHFICPTCLPPSVVRLLSKKCRVLLSADLPLSCPVPRFVLSCRPVRLLR